ncbi:VOC family protein [Aquimarina sp. ERC-38]|uniref:VOC family protein n=1 Tax=Aquimarina sp. ERC-38 TaxID=2949996 RepID=UPI002246C4E3|nr:VOC family protein [Aquimarina sp. ERC-38]UZO79976.1 VOC family protein [Aquimarina sp. ERC-38]
MNLNQVTVPSLNLKRAVSFYQKLGLRLIVESIPTYARFECPEGDSTFSIHLVEKLPEGEGVYTYFETYRLDKEVEKLVQEGITFLSLPEDKPWLWREDRLKDPDGNLIIFYQAGENRKNPPWRITT